MHEEQSYQIEVTIESEAIFSSGEKEGNTVQQKVLTDGYGFVYFHAKSLKGQLKKQAFWLLELYNTVDQTKANQFIQSIAFLFGTSAQEKERYKHLNLQWPQYREGAMQFAHLQLPWRVRAHLRQILEQEKEKQYYDLSPHDLIQAQTQVRTGIQLEEGTAKKKMLTTYHTVKEGLIFCSPLTFMEDPALYLDDLWRIIHSWSRIGSGIHRGRGEIVAKLLLGEHTAPEPENRSTGGGDACASVHRAGN